MDDGALREALQRLLAHGEAAKDSKLMSMANAKKAPLAVADVCPKCGAPMSEAGDGPDTCTKCGYVSADAEDNADQGGLADLLDGGAKG